MNLPAGLRAKAPLVLLIVLCALSIGARVYHLDIPRETRSGTGFIFDEKYYVNAARVIAGVRMNPFDTYALAAPSGADPNGEHPQLGKVIIAAGIQLVGDNPIGWRITAVLFGTAALLLLYWLVRCLGGSPWLALGAAALGAADNLWLVHGRIAVLDIFCVPFMLGGAAFYLRRQPLISGLLIGIGACIKEFAVFALLAILLLEAMRGVRWLVTSRSARSRRSLWRAVRAPLAVTVFTVAAFFSLLAVLDATVVPFNSGHAVDRGQASACRYALVWQGACNHFSFMNAYAQRLRSPKGPTGIASYPWQFWLDTKAITYYTSNRLVRTGNVVTSVKTTVNFQGFINPLILGTGCLAIVLCGYWAVRRGDDVAMFVVAWTVATWLPEELFSLVDQRTTYLYYMVVTMPAIYIAVARLLGQRLIPRWVVGTWAGVLLSLFVVLYPFRTLTGS